MNNIYIITSGCYSDYGIHSVWTDESEAEKMVILLDRGDPNAEFQVETYLLDSLLKNETKGFIGTYDVKANGYTVDIANIKIQELVYSKYFSKTTTSVNKIVTVRGETIEAVQRIILDEVARQYDLYFS